MNLKVINAVGSGDLGVEIDLNQLTSAIDEVEFDPNNYPGAYVRLRGVEPLITVYRTGKYIITESKSEEEAYRCKKGSWNFFLTRG
jgi:transcription initiation factor TFIID TATA-box-binding protein